MKVKITVYVEPETKEYLKTRKNISMSRWVRNLIKTRRYGYDKYRFNPIHRKSRLEYQRKYVERNRKKTRNYIRNRYNESKEFREYQMLRSKVCYNADRFNVGDYI